MASTSSATADCGIDPPIGAPARFALSPTRLNTCGSTPSRLRPNTYRPTPLWNDSIAPKIEVISSKVAMYASGLP